jgi:hypothetical protein
MIATNNARRIDDDCRCRDRFAAALDDFLEYKHIVLNPGVVGVR